MRAFSSLFLVLLVLVAGCSDDNSSAPDAGLSDTTLADSGPDLSAPDSGPAPGPITVTVLKLEGVWQDDLTTAPAAGATVAADLPGGTREEQTVPADGKLTFSNVNWATGTLALTAYLKGYRLFSMVGLTREEGDPTMYLLPVQPGGRRCP